MANISRIDMRSHHSGDNTNSHASAVFLARVALGDTSKYSDDHLYLFKCQLSATSVTAHSNQFVRFLARVRDIVQQLESVDAALDVVKHILKSCESHEVKIVDALRVSKKQYGTLNAPIKSFGSIVNRTKKNNHDYAFRAIYTYFGEYFRGALKEIFQTNPLLVVSKAPGTLEYHLVAKLGSFDAIADYMVRQVFKKLESEKSTRKLLDKILANTGVSVSTEVFERALMYLEVRHLLVHNMGICDEAFFSRFNAIFPAKLYVGGKFPLSIGFVRNALDAITEFVSEVDAKLVSGALLASAPNETPKPTPEIGAT